MKSVLLACALFSLAARGHEGGHDARGVVTSISASELTLQTSHGEKKFVLTPGTEFVKDGAPATAQDLKPSTRAVVHAIKKSGRIEAVKVLFSAAHLRHGLTL